jgi:hypothetical protein
MPDSNQASLNLWKKLVEGWKAHEYRGRAETQDSRVSVKQPAAKSIAAGATLGSFRGRDMTLVLRNTNALSMLGFNN